MKYLTLTILLLISANTYAGCTTIIVNGNPIVVCGEDIE